MIDNESPVPFAPIYLDEHELFCVVDIEDHAWAISWLWAVKYDKHGRKIYAYRSSWANGRRVSIFLHKEICKRRHGPPPTKHHIVADHMDGVSLNCRGDNMRWATRSENRLNINGWYARQFRLQLENTNAHHA